MAGAWYVAKSKPQKEAVLSDFLSQCGVEVFFPKIVQPGPRGDSWQALFPTYLFCSIGPEARMPVVRWAPGMAYFLTFDGELAQVPGQLLEYLQRRVAEWNARHSSCSLNQGDHITILRGPFAGLDGIFQKYTSGQQRCQILLEILGRLARVELPERDVRGACGLPYTLKG